MFLARDWCDGQALTEGAVGGETGVVTSHSIGLMIHVLGYPGPTLLRGMNENTGTRFDENSGNKHMYKPTLF